MANLADTQLNTDLSYGRSTTQQDSETRRNTQLNKFAGFTEDSFNSQLDNLAGGYKNLDLKPKIISRDEADTEGYYVLIFHIMYSLLYIRNYLTDNNGVIIYRARNIIRHKAN